MVVNWENRQFTGHVLLAPARDEWVQAPGEQVRAQGVAAALNGVVPMLVEGFFVAQ